MTHVIAATGHRPDKLGGFSRPVWCALVAHARSFLEIMEPSGVISGMALGWDQAMARAALDLDIPVIAALPFAGQADRWPRHARNDYFRLLAEVTTKIKVWEQPGYETEDIRGALLARNRWMVDNCGLVVALWDGSSGGTGHCVEYAKSVNRDLINGWGGFVHLRDTGGWLI